MLKIEDVANYILLNIGDELILNIKLQILLYYCNAWYLAKYGINLFEEKFEARVFGPVNKLIYEKYGNSLYESINKDYVKNFDGKIIPYAIIYHIDNIIKKYIKYDHSELIFQFRTDLAYRHARKNHSSNEIYSNIIDTEVIKTYYTLLIPILNLEKKLLQE